ncbi:MAG: VOC family protein [Anaerolineae bacterium]|nr:VOC family protein [Anaerolineae bacterium]
MGNEGLGTRVICQVGLVVRDIERSAEAYSRILGLPRPQIVVTDPPEVAHTRFRGQPTDARAKLAFFDMGQVTLELIEPIGGPSTWREFLDEKGEGVHHIAFMVRDTDQVVQYLAAHGIEAVQQGDYTGGRYTYVDSVATLGVILELLENFAESERR